MSRRSLMASQTYWSREDTLLASCHAMLVTNLPAWPTSPPPREKKKLAPRRFWSRHLRATVRAIVDFPVPAKPFSQKMHRSSCPSAQLYMSRRRSTRVSGRQVGSCRRWYALNGASAAVGRVLSTPSKSRLLVSLVIWRTATYTHFRGSLNTLVRERYPQRPVNGD